MRVLHLCLGCFYIDGYSYQENILPRINKEHGHDVLIIASTETFVDNINLGYVEPSEYYNEDNIKVIRLPYYKFLSSTFTRKTKRYLELYEKVEEFNPDTIMYHGVCGYALLDIAKYVKNHPGVLFYVDSHEDFGNTARNLLSKAYYKYIHGIFIRKSLPYINKVLYLGEDPKIYLKEMYNISDEKLEFYPLGGVVQSKEEQRVSRGKFLDKYGLDTNAIIFMHSGKMVSEKKTANLLKAFKKLRNENIYMFIFGSIPQETENEITRLIDEDNRVFYLGWKSENEVMDLLRAADVYCQPGTPSSTSQGALCCGCAEIVYPFISYKVMYGDSVLYAENDDELYKQLQELCKEDVMKKYKEKGYKRACEILDYEKLAERYLR